MEIRAYRLPQTVWPLHCHIELWLDFQKPSFPGVVTLSLDMREVVDVVALHAQNIRVDEAVWLVDGTEVKAPSVETDATNQRLLIGVPAGAQRVGSAELRIRYEGQVNPGLTGLYKAQDGNEVTLCTQCQATSARQIFPCFDEPEFKAPLQWTLHTATGVLALTNGVLQEQKTTGTEQVWKFHPTRKISSYLAALVVGELEGAAPVTVRDVPLGTYATQGRKAQTEFAQSFAAKLLPFYEDYFGVKYPYGKYDQVAVPGFDAGAMENIGLVLFRQTALLLDPKTASWRQEKRVASVVAHEMAHMWFGNWVTMRWWDDLWLNEAFAEWMCHKALEAIAPAYEVWDDFQEGRSHAMIDDALPTTRSIWSPVETPEQATEMFDTITYEKGCAVMRMLENFLGAVPFREGLRAYMKTYAESNATGNDLWAALSHASKHDVAALMHAWVAQPGFPVLTVAPDEQQGGWARGALRLSQRRFFATLQEAHANNDQQWHIPVVIRYADDQGEHVAKVLVTQPEQTLTLAVQGSLRWCYANAGEIGFYRVRYEGPAWEALLTTGLSALHPVEQAGLLDDQWALVQNGQRPVEPFLLLVEQLAASPRRQVLRVVQERLHILERLIEDANHSETERSFRQWVQRIVPVLNKTLAAPGEHTADASEFAAMVLATRAQMGHEREAIAWAQSLAEQERNNPQALDPNFSGTVVAIAARFGDANLYQRCVETYLSRKQAGLSPQETLRYLQVLCLFRDPALVSRTLQGIEEGLVPQDMLRFVLAGLLVQRHAQQTTWQYLQDHWDVLKDKVGDMGLSRLVESVGALPYSWREQVIAFFETHPPLRAERALIRALKRMEQYHRLFDRLRTPLQAYFAPQTNRTKSVS